MKSIKWKILFVTVLICLTPILFGLFLWDRLPEQLAIHFDIYGTPDNFAPKGFVVFGLPAIMAAVQAFCCVVNDLNIRINKKKQKVKVVVKWLLPCMSVVIQAVTLAYGIGLDMDMRKTSAVIVGVIFIVLGKYMPRTDSASETDSDEKTEKINRFNVYAIVTFGVLLVISACLPPVATIACLGLLVAYGIISVVIASLVNRK